MAINLERLISNLCCNSCQSFYDHYVEANVKFRSSLGMKNLIIRRQLGNCCDWCAKLAGIYNVYDAPDDIYRRHTNCRCLVTYKSDKGYQNVWNKKVYKSQKDARLDRIKELSNVNKFENFDIEKRKLLSENKHIYDATNEWRAKAEPNKYTICNIDQVRIDKKKYTVDGKHVLLDQKEHEKEVLDKFVKTFGGKLEYYPRILLPKGIKTPDCIFNGIKFDLKQPGLNNEGIVGNNVLFNAISKKQMQSHCFIFDITRTALTDEQAISQAYKLFLRDKTKFVEKIVLYNGEFFKIFEKI